MDSMLAEEGADIQVLRGQPARQRDYVDVFAPIGLLKSREAPQTTEPADEHKASWRMLNGLPNQPDIRFLSGYSAGGCLRCFPLVLNGHVLAFVSLIPECRS
jgi:hypothetical protein